MGAYLSVPDTEKHSTHDKLERLSYGASSCQGWRATQEDAHNCIPQFDDNVSLFAVYDGHGGAEVAQYCSMRLPDYIKSMPTYNTGNLAQALEDAFLGFDELLTRPDVISELKVLSGDSEDPSDVENEVDHLFAEANMPLDQVLAKYGNDVPPQLTPSAHNPILAHLRDNKPLSPFLRAKPSDKGDSSKEKIPMDKGDLIDDSAEIINGDNIINDKNETNVVNGANDETDVKTETKKDGENGVIVGQSGDDCYTPTKNRKTDDVIVSSSTPSSSVLSSSSSEQVAGSSGSSNKTRSAKKSDSVIDNSSDESTSDEDESYEGGIPYADDSSDSDEDDTGIEKEADSDDDEDESESEDEIDEGDDVATNKREVPGSDSGCTAVVALLRGDCLYVANAGDSRCIVCRGGKAIDMSVDHKPEDELERNRIVAAGGTVTSDGRVDGGLNLSRAIGDHTYKQNKDIAAKDQMISALPDIRTLTIDPAEDEFMVLACDGIWNSMSSQEVADFVQERLRCGTENLAKICEEMFDHCMAPNTRGDGTGCDNMTAIVVQFHKGLATTLHNLKKRANVEHAIENPSKRSKMDIDNDDTELTALQ